MPISYLLGAIKDVTVVTEKDEISLVVKRNHASSFELRIPWNKGRKKSTDRCSKTGIESVQYHFRIMRSGLAVFLSP